MSMSKREIEIRDAVVKAQEFIVRANTVLLEMKEMRLGPLQMYYGGPANASMKRGSLDLTKALVKIRKPL